MAAVERYHASQYESFLVSFETDSGQTRLGNPFQSRCNL